MIEKSIVKGLVEEWLEGRDYFLVDVSVSSDDRIVVEIDHAEGVWIREPCGERGGRAHGRRAQAPRGVDGRRPGGFRGDDEGQEEAGGGEASPPGGRSGYTTVYGSKVHEVFNKF